MGFPARWEKRPPWVVKYVDDVTEGGENLLQHSTSHITTQKEHRMVHAGDLEGVFNIIEENSTKAGMVVNPKKTQLLCVTGSINYNVDSYINLRGTRIYSSETLRVLGMTIDSKCTMAAHVRGLKRKFSSRIWILRHLKRSRMSADDLLRMFNVYIRPTLEYACPTFHPMLTGGMRDDIEMIQKRACRIIFGINMSYDVLVNDKKIETLEARRERLTVNFAKKCANSERFKHWFVKKPETNLRRSLVFEESFARTERLKKSPLYYMRRALNNEENSVKL